MTMASETSPPPLHHAGRNGNRALRRRSHQQGERPNLWPGPQQWHTSLDPIAALSERHDIMHTLVRTRPRAAANVTISTSVGVASTPSSPLPTHCAATGPEHTANIILADFTDWQAQNAKHEGHCLSSLRK